MTSPTDRAGNKDRDAAIKTVEAALASGRIVQADRDKRVDELRRSKTMQDIQVQIGDLMPSSPVESAVIAPVAAMSTGVQGPPAPPTATPSGSAFGAGGQQWPLVNYGAPSAASTVAAAGAKAGRRIGGIVAAIILVSVVVPIVGAVIAFASARNSFDFGSVGTAPSDDQTYLPGQAPGSHGVNLFTVAGYEKMIAALKTQTGGSTSLYEAVVYPRYAVLEVPDNTGPGHYQDFYYNGKSMSLEDVKEKTDDPAFDVSLVDPNVMINTLKTLRARVDNPTSWYCVASSDEQTPELSCYASNAYGDDSYELLTFDGTVVYDSAQSQ